MLLLLLSAAAVVIATASWVIYRGFSAREQPSALKSYVATSVRNLSVPSRAKDVARQTKLRFSFQAPEHDERRIQARSEMGLHSSW